MSLSHFLMMEKGQLGRTSSHKSKLMYDALLHISMRTAETGSMYEGLRGKIIENKPK